MVVSTLENHALVPVATAPIDVLATLAHEFRTPIASLRATVDALIADRDLLSAGQTAEMLGRLQRGTLWLQGFVENFLSAASLDARQLRIRRLVRLGSGRSHLTGDDRPRPLRHRLNVRGRRVGTALAQGQPDLPEPDQHGEDGEERPLEGVRPAQGVSLGGTARLP